MNDKENIENDILQNKALKRYPFDVPEEYFTELEDSVHKKIHKKPSGFTIFFIRLKPALMLALTFGIIAGLGYGVAALTDKIVPQTTQEDPLYSLIDEGYINSDFIYSYYEDIDFKTAFIDNIEINDEIIDYYLNESSTEELYQIFSKNN